MDLIEYRRTLKLSRMRRLLYFIRIGVIDVIDMRKWLRNLFIDIRVRFNNFRAILNRKLCEAGFGGGIVNGWTELNIQHIRNGKVINRRRVLDRVVTNAFVNDIVDVLQGIAGSLGTINAYKYHASGTGTTAEDIADTALAVEVGSRVVGTQVEGNANQYKSVATITYSGTYAITEHGLFNASTGGTLMDRTVFSPVNVISGDSIVFTFQISFNAGS